MAHEGLKEAVWNANMDIVEAGLVTLTWGNASGVDRDAGVMAIKPSGVTYDRLQPSDIVVVSLDDGEPVEDGLNPSSDTPTHLYLYREFDGVGGIVHTHSSHAVSWAQADRQIPCLGTTHADHFNGPIPVTRRMRDDEIERDYERNTGAVIIECFADHDPTEMPGVLVAGHGPFAWGPTVEVAVQNAVVLEEVARMALNTFLLNDAARPIKDALLHKHFRRKHGPEAYYGQPSEPE